jgi:hypothetical protein
LEQLIRFCDEALFYDQDEEQAIRKVYRQFGYPIVPSIIDTSHLLNRFVNDSIDTIDNAMEILLTDKSSIAEKVQFYVFHLKALLKTSDQQHISTVSDFDDALLQFSSFISNGMFNMVFVDCFRIQRSSNNRIRIENVAHIGHIDGNRDQSGRYLCQYNLVSLVLFSTAIL